jgi:hypothetical protein
MFFRAVFPFVIVAVLSVTAGYFAACWLDGEWARVAVKIAVTAVVYLGALRVARVGVLSEAIGFLRGMMRRKK